MPSIKPNDLLIPMMGVRRTVVAYKVAASSQEGELAIPAQASNGAVALKVASIRKNDEVGLPALGCDGKAVAVQGSGRALGMIMAFIDESIREWAGGSLGWYYPDNTADWDADANRWQALVDEYGPPEYAAVFRVANPGLTGIGNPLKPANRSMPAEIKYYQTVPRSPGLQTFIDCYNFCKGGPDKPHPRKVIFNIDMSGSMTRSAITPGIDQFEAWLTNGGTDVPDPNTPAPPIAWEEKHDYTQLWLRSTCNWYEDVRLEKLLNITVRPRPDP